MADCYIAIMDFGGIFYPLYGVSSQFYKTFKEIAEKRGCIKIAAEMFDVPSNIADELSEKGLVRKLADRLEQGEKFDSQKELENLCKKRS